MKKTTLVAVAVATAFTASSTFAWWGEGEHHEGKKGCKSEHREHRGKAHKKAKFKEHMNRELNASEVRTLQEARLIYLNNPNITVGGVTSTDKGYTVTIVTKENQSLVEERLVAKNGMPLERYEAIQKRLEKKKQPKQ